MSRFPKTYHYTGLNTPVGIEASVRNLEVIGQIPPEVKGVFFRAVADPAVPPKYADENMLSGDGMISRFLFEDGAVDFDIKYVRTARYEAERKARKALFGRYRNPFTDDPEVNGVDRTVANTTPIWHGGRLFMAKEDTLPYEINPHTLETVGRWNYHGALKSETITAHARIDAKTGEMFFYGYEAGGLCTTDVAYCIADKDGKLASEQWFKQPYCSMMHDFVITERHAIFPVFPTTADMDRLKAGGNHWEHQLDMAFNQKKPAEAFETYVGPYYIQHDPTTPDGKEATVKLLSSWLPTVPDLHVDIKRIASDGDMVWVHSHVTRGAGDRGIAAVAIFRLREGKVVEHWEVRTEVPEKALNDNTMF